MAGIEAIKKSVAFKEADYLLPRISKDLNGFIARPATYSTSLGTLKKILCNMVQATELATFTWHSLRVFMPHWAFVQGVDKSKRQYLGRWTNESTADVYVRSHRTMICDIWNQVTQSQFQPAAGLVSTDTGEPMSDDGVVEVDPDQDEYTTMGGQPIPSDVSPVPSVVRTLDFDTPSIVYLQSDPALPNSRHESQTGGDNHGRPCTTSKRTLDSGFLQATHRKTGDSQGSFLHHITDSSWMWMGPESRPDTDPGKL